jgi:hypothetical protein
MFDFNTELEKLNFHDSNIRSFSLENADRFYRKAIIDIDYYNWENNEEGVDNWKWKRLLLKVDHCFHIRFITPDLIEHGFEIMDIECLKNHDKIIAEYNLKKPKIYINILKEREFNNSIAVRFLTNCYGNNLFGSEHGFLEIAGFDASIEWSDEDISHGQIHIPAGK